MARDLKELQKRYNSSSHMKGPGGPGPRHGGPGMRGGFPGGKPKKTKETIARIISYFKNQKLKLLGFYLTLHLFYLPHNHLILSFDIHYYNKTLDHYEMH